MPKPFRASDLHGSGKDFRDLVHVIAGYQDPAAYVEPAVRLVIAGSREGIDPAIVFKAIDVWVSRFGMPDLIISGHARGVDLLGERWAKHNKVKFVTYPADWQKLGKSAGHVRNEKMGALCTHGLVIHANTGGSLNMVGILRKLNKPIVEVIKTPAGFDIRT